MLRTDGTKRIKISKKKQKQKKNKRHGGLVTQVQLLEQRHLHPLEEPESTQILCFVIFSNLFSMLFTLH